MAKNIRLIGEYLSEDAVAGATNTAAGYSAQNAIALDRHSSWKSSGTAAVRLWMFKAGGIGPSGLGIALTNYSAYGAAVLQHSTDGIAWTTHTAIGGLGSRIDYDEDYYMQITAAPTKEWWALYWAAPVAAPEVGLFYLGVANELERNDSYPGEYADVFNTVLDKSEGGVIVAEDTARDLYRVRMNYRNTTPTQLAQVRAFLKKERGPRRPFFYVPQDETGSANNARAYLMRQVNPEFSFTRKAIATYGIPSIELLEEV